MINLKFVDSSCGWSAVYLLWVGEGVGGGGNMCTIIATKVKEWAIPIFGQEHFQQLSN